MKRLFLLLVLFAIYSAGNAQIRTVYFNEEDQVVQDSTEAVSYALMGKVMGDSVYTVKKFDDEGYMMMTGAYKDDSLKVPHGNFVYYDWVDVVSPLGNEIAPPNGKERFISLKGTFRNGLREGIWMTYYQNGSLKDVITYRNNLMNGPYKRFDYKGALQLSGNFVNNKREGTWIQRGGREISQFKDDKEISSVKKSKKELELEQAAKSK
jgi:hypothetical protein